MHKLLCVFIVVFVYRLFGWFMRTKCSPPRPDARPVDRVASAKDSRQSERRNASVIEVLGRENPSVAASGTARMPPPQKTRSVPEVQAASAGPRGLYPPFNSAAIDDGRKIEASATVSDPALGTKRVVWAPTVDWEVCDDDAKCDATGGDCFDANCRDACRYRYRRHPNNDPGGNLPRLSQLSAGAVDVQSTSRPDMWSVQPATTSESAEMVERQSVDETGSLSPTSVRSAQSLVSDTGSQTSIASRSSGRNVATTEARSVVPIGMAPWMSSRQISPMEPQSFGASDSPVNPAGVIGVQSAAGATGSHTSIGSRSSARNVATATSRSVPIGTTSWNTSRQISPAERQSFGERESPVNRTSVQSPVGATGSQTSIGSRSSGRNVATAASRSVPIGTTSWDTSRQISPVEPQSFEARDPPANRTSVQSLVGATGSQTSMTSQLSANVDDMLTQLAAMSSIASRRTGPPQDQETRLEPEVWLEQESEISGFEEDPEEETVIGSEDREGDVNTESLIAQLRELSTIMDEQPRTVASIPARRPTTPPRQPPVRPETRQSAPLLSGKRPKPEGPSVTPATRRRPPTGSPGRKSVAGSAIPVRKPATVQAGSSAATKRASIGQKPAASLPSKLPLGAKNRVVRGRTYDQPTISAAAKQATKDGPVFTWKEPSSTPNAGRSITVLNGRRLPPVSGPTGQDAGERPAAHRNRNAGTSGGGLKSGGERKTDRQPRTGADQPRPVVKDVWPVAEADSYDGRLVDVDELSDSTTSSNFGDEVSDLAAKLQSAGGGGGGGGAWGSADRRQCRPRREGDDGAARQTVEDVYVEAMCLDAKGRVSGQSSPQWRRELTRIIDSLRHQLKSQATKQANTRRLRLLTSNDLDEASRFTTAATTARQKTRR